MRKLLVITWKLSDATHCVTAQTSGAKPRRKLKQEKKIKYFLKYCNIAWFILIMKKYVTNCKTVLRSEGWSALVEREQQWKDESYIWKQRRMSIGESSGAKYSTIADCRSPLSNILTAPPLLSKSFFSPLDSSVAFFGCWVEVLSDRTQQSELNWWWAHWAPWPPSAKTFAKTFYKKISKWNETFTVSCLQCRASFSIVMK